MDKLEDSWNSFSPDVALGYLKTHGYPSENSKAIVLEILKKYSGTRKISVLDLGCGNAQLYEHFKAMGLHCFYVGVDFSAALLEAAKTIHRNDENIRLIKDDVSELGMVDGKYDFAIYSHVIEIMSSPEKSLLKAQKLARGIIIRFFEPPDFEDDTVELKEMDVGQESKVPYLRRKMGKDYYRLILTKMGCTRVDVYRDESAKDQVHVLHY